MSSFSVTNNIYLRQAYGNERNLASGTERLKVNSKDLAKADSAALKRSISSLSDYDYDAETEDKDKLSQTLKAFADTYNYTLESGSSLSSDSRYKGLMKEMSKLREDYEDQLGNYGITFDSKGYMSVSSSATKNVSAKSFKAMTGEDSEFMNQLKSLSQRMHKRVDYLA